MIDLDAIEDRHIRATIEASRVRDWSTFNMDALLDSASDVTDLIAEVRRLQPLARRYERLMETHTVVQGVSLG